MKPLSESSYSCSDNSFISDGANRYGARATGAALGIRSIWNSTGRAGGRPGKSSGNTFGKSRMIVTYTSIYTDSEPGRVFWGADEELSDEGSTRVIVYGCDGLPMLPPHDLDFVLEPIYPEYIPLEDEHILLAEEQPLPPVVSPTAESPGYVVESDPEEDPEEYEEDETEDGPVDYPMDGGYDGDDDDGDSSGYDADDEDEDEEDEEEEEHLA
nr:hypothetical protein [Tanacetum cinerariifolium]